MTFDRNVLTRESDLAMLRYLDMAHNGDDGETDIPDCALCWDCTECPDYNLCADEALMMEV